MDKYYVETGCGCTIINAESEKEAYDKALREVGTFNGVDLVRKATKKDIAWVMSMKGGE